MCKTYTLGGASAPARVHDAGEGVASRTSVIRQSADDAWSCFEKCIDVQDLNIGPNGTELGEDRRRGAAVIDDEFDGWGRREDVGERGEQLGVSEQADAVRFVQGVGEA